MIRKINRSFGQDKVGTAESTPPPADAQASAPSAAPISAYDDIPFLSTWAIQQKDRKQMFAWWDAMEEWLHGHSELVKTTKDAIITITMNEKPFARYADLESYIATYDKNPNLAVDKWLAAMERALPDEIVTRGESAVDPRWLKPLSIYMGMQGLGQTITGSSTKTILIVLAILFVIGGGIYLLKGRFKK